MGVYLSKPVKEKVSTNCENVSLKCGASSMQGWRVSQEDAHNCCLDYDEGVSLFAVYDGHGGHEVAQYAAQELPEFIKRLDTYKSKDFEKALRDSFLGFDETLKNNEIVEKLKKIAKESKGRQESDDDDDEVDEDENDVQKLKDEANMPLTEVFAKYTGLPKTPSSIERLKLGETSKSPCLRAKTSSSSDVEVSSSSAETKVNGLSETNGEVAPKDSDDKTNGGQNEISSSVQNGEVVDSTSSGKPSEESPSKADENEATSSPSAAISSTETTKERISKKKAVQLVHKVLLEGLQGYESSDTDDSDDTSFKTTDLRLSSDEEEEDEEGGKTNGNKSNLGEEDEKEEEEEGDEEEEEAEEEEEESDDEMFDVRRENEEPGIDSGCTAVVALVTGDKIFVANAGDSRAVLCRAGKAVDLSIDHKPEDAPEMKRIKAAGGKITYDGRVNGGLNLSRALGDHLYKRVPELDATEQMITALPDIRIESIIKPEDEFLVLACDGIWNSLSSQEVVDFVKPLIDKEEKLSNICEMLFEKCLAPHTLGDGAGCDNMTCVIVQFLHKDKTETKDQNLQQEQSLKRSADQVDETTVEEVDTSQQSKKLRVDST